MARKVVQHTLAIGALLKLHENVVKEVEILQGYADGATDKLVIEKLKRDDIAASIKQLGGAIPAKVAKSEPTPKPTSEYREIANYTWTISDNIMRHLELAMPSPEYVMLREYLRGRNFKI